MLNVKSQSAAFLLKVTLLSHFDSGGFRAVLPIAQVELLLVLVTTLEPVAYDDSSPKA